MYQQKKKVCYDRCNVIRHTISQAINHTRHSHVIDIQSTILYRLRYMHWSAVAYDIWTQQSPNNNNYHDYYYNRVGERIGHQVQLTR